MSNSLPSGLPDRLLTMKETAEYLNVSYRWIEEAVRGKRIRCTKLGRSVRFTREQIQEILAANEQAPLVSTELPLTLLADQPKRSAVSGRRRKL